MRVRDGEGRGRRAHGRAGRSSPCAADACAFFGRNGAILLFRSPPDDLVGNYRFSTDWLVK